MKKDIFISYRNDGIGNNFATRITNDLRQKGYSVYFNPDEARSGDFPERLERAIEECKDFICVVTEEYLANLIANNKICWIREELLCAKRNGKNIVPLLVNGAKMPNDSETLVEELRFFPKIDAFVFPEQYISSPFSLLCGILLSKNDGTNGFRDVDKSSNIFDPDLSLEDEIKKAQNGDEKSMLCVGIYYYYGISGGKDERKAAYWFKQVSSLKGEYAPIADKFIARMYYAGSMPREEQSYEKSYEYHVKSSIGDIYSAGQVGFMQSCDTVHKVVTDTTRSPRKGEVDKVHYNFVSEQFFRENIDSYVEYNEYDNHLYGSNGTRIADALDGGKADVVICLDINGAKALKKHYGEQVRVIYVHRDIEKIYDAIDERVANCEMTAESAVHRKEQVLRDIESRNDSAIDFEVDNNGTLDNSIGQLKEIMGL